MLRTRIGKRSRLYIFGLVIQDHIESIGKPILLKGGKVLLVNKMPIRAQVIVTKNTHKLFHKSMSIAKYS